MGARLKRMGFLTREWINYRVPTGGRVGGGSYTPSPVFFLYEPDKGELFVENFLNRYSPFFDAPHSKSDALNP